MKAGSLKASLIAEGWEVLKAKVTTGEAWEIENPEAQVLGRRITIIVENESGGALGALTWGSKFRAGTFALPANNKAKTISFIYNGEHWNETGQGSETAA